MTDADISTRDALRHLSRTPQTSTMGRRRFLQLLGAGAAAGVAGGQLLDMLADGGHDTAWAAGPLPADQRVLIVIGMMGGNDGLNTVIPVNDPHYRTQRGALAISSATALPIDADTGLNPALSELKQFWDRGQLAIVEGVGYPNPSLSHFDSMARWMSGRVSGIPDSGWLGRWLDGHLAGGPDLWVAAEISSSVPLHVIGRQRASTAVPAGSPLYGGGTSANDIALYNALRQLGPAGSTTWRDRSGRALVDALDVAARTVPLMADPLPTGTLAAKLVTAARLINADIGFRIVSASWGDFDSHAGQPAQHNARMVELNDSIAALFATLSPQWRNRVTVMTFSEFGRTPYSNDGAGTDHGTSAPHFVFGSNVRGGRYGVRPTLAGLGRWDRMNHTVDFRDMYASVAENVLGTGSSSVLSGYTPNLIPMFTTTPTVVPPATPTTTTPPVTTPPTTTLPPTTTPPTVPPPATTPVGTGRFVAVVPHRLVDTRNGIGATKRRVGAGGELTVGTLSRGGLPATGVTAVILNVTSVAASADTYLTVYPADQALTATSALNTNAGAVTANMVTVGVDGAGQFKIRNYTGDTDIVIDIVGAYITGNGDRFTSLTPARLLDTRNGIGAPVAKIGAGGELKLAVAGRGGVPAAGVSAVAVTAVSVNPNAAGFLTAWPTGAARPVASMLNYAGGDVTSNMTVCKLGADGAIMLYSHSGQPDLVVDVVGYYSNTGAAMTPVRPDRVVDSRHGLGTPLKRFQAGEQRSIVVTGVAGVPANASAVAVNVTAITPDAPTYVSVTPGPTWGAPDTSSVNVNVGRNTAAAVICKTGGDRTISVYNHSGTLDIVVDVVGYFT